MPFFYLFRNHIILIGVDRHYCEGLFKDGLDVIAEARPLNNYPTTDGKRPAVALNTSSEQVSLVILDWFGGTSPG